MSTDINEHVLTEVHSSKYGFAIQLDETTDVSNCAQLPVFVRYATTDFIRSELLLSNEFRTTTRGEDVFEIIDSFFQKNVLQWSKLVDCTIDGAPALLLKTMSFKLV